MPQLVGEIHMNLMRVYQTAGLIPQRLLFFLAVFADVHNLWRLVNAFAVFEDWNEKFAHGVGARREVCLFPCLDRIEEQKGILLIELFIHETDQICDNLASLLVIDSLDGLVARIGNLFCIFRKLDLRDKFACVTVLDGSQLIGPILTGSASGNIPTTAVTLSRSSA